MNTEQKPKYNLFLMSLVTIALPLFYTIKAIVSNIPDPSRNYYPAGVSTIGSIIATSIPVIITPIIIIYLSEYFAKNWKSTISIVFLGIINFLVIFFALTLLLGIVFEIEYIGEFFLGFVTLILTTYMCLRIGIFNRKAQSV